VCHLCIFSCPYYVITLLRPECVKTKAKRWNNKKRQGQKTKRQKKQNKKKKQEMTKHTNKTKKKHNAKQNAHKHKKKKLLRLLRSNKKKRQKSKRKTGSICMFANRSHMKTILGACLQ